MKRQRYPKSLKEQLVREVQEAGNAVPVAKRHGVNIKTLYRWIHESKHKAWEVAADDAKKIAPYLLFPHEFRQVEKENDQLKKILSEKDFEIAIIEGSCKKGSPRLLNRIEIVNKWIARGYACAVVLRIVGINEQTYYYRKMQEAIPQRNHTSQGGRILPDSEAGCAGICNADQIVP